MPFAPFPSRRTRRLTVACASFIAASGILASACSGDGATSSTCSVSNPSLTPSPVSVKQGQTVRVGFVADYSVACGNILTDDGAWTSADPTTVSVAQDVTNPLLATVGGVKVGGPVLVKFVGGPRGIAALTATVQVTVTAANR